MPVPTAIEELMKQNLQRTEDMRPDNATILAVIKKHATTKTQAEIAALLGLPLHWVGGVGRKAGFKKPHVSGKLRAKQAHQREVILAHGNTHTLAEMGGMLGVTGEYVRQLCEKWQIKRSINWNYALSGIGDAQLRKLVRQPDKFLTEIAKEIGVAAKTLMDKLRRRGIKPFTKRERDARLLKRKMRICYRCRRTKPIDRFARNAIRPSGYGFLCLECTAAKTAEWRKRKANRS